MSMCECVGVCVQIVFLTVCFCVFVCAYVCLCVFEWV